MVIKSYTNDIIFWFSLNTHLKFPGLQAAIAELIRKAEAEVPNPRAAGAPSAPGGRPGARATLPGFAGKVIEEVIIGDAPTKEIEEIIVEDLPPNKVVEEVIIEDASVPEIIAQEIIIKDGTITHIGAAPLNGFFQPDHIGRSVFSRVEPELG